MSTTFVFVAWAYFAVVSVLLTIIDVRTHRLPNRIVLPSYVVLVVLWAGACMTGLPWNMLVRAIIAGAVLFGAFYCLRMLPGGGMGGGDVKLAGVIGLFLGFLGLESVLVGVVASFFSGGVFALILVLFRRAGRRTHIAFGPFLLVGAWCGFAAGVAPVWASVMA